MHAALLLPMTFSSDSRCWDWSYPFLWLPEVCPAVLAVLSAIDRVFPCVSGCVPRRDGQYRCVPFLPVCVVKWRICCRLQRNARLLLPKIGECRLPGVEAAERAVLHGPPVVGVHRQY